MMVPIEKIENNLTRGTGYTKMSDLVISSTGVFKPLISLKGEKKKFHGTVANLPGCGCKRDIDDILKRRILRMVTEEPRTTKRIEVNIKDKVRSYQITPSVAVCTKVDVMEDDRGGHHC